jgi:hypothetical protein
VRLPDGRYKCGYCGAIIDIPSCCEPEVMISATSGEPNIRALIIDRDEVHSCVIFPTAHSPERMRHPSVQTHARSQSLRSRN